MTNYTFLKLLLQEEHCEIILNKIRSILVFDPIEPMGFDRFNYNSKSVAQTQVKLWYFLKFLITSIGEIILAPLYNQLWNLTPCTGSHFDFMQIKIFLQLIFLDIFMSYYVYCRLYHREKSLQLVLSLGQKYYQFSWPTTCRLCNWSWDIENLLAIKSTMGYWWNSLQVGHINEVLIIINYLLSAVVGALINYFLSALDLDNCLLEVMMGY